MGVIKAWKKANRVTHDPPGTTNPALDQEKRTNGAKKKKKKNATRKLKDFWENKRQQQKNLSPKSDAVSLKDAVMQLPTKKDKKATQQDYDHRRHQHQDQQEARLLSPRTEQETLESPSQQIPVLPNEKFSHKKSTGQIFRRQLEAPGGKREMVEIVEVIVPALEDSNMGSISPVTIEGDAFQHHQPNQKQPSMPGHFLPEGHNYTEGLGVEIELADALQLPSLEQQRQHVSRRGREGGILDDLASETTSSASRGRGPERAQDVSARSRRRILRPMSGDRVRREPDVDPVLSTAIDLVDVEKEEDALDLLLGLDDPANAFDDISNPLTAVPDVFGSLTDLLQDPPAAGEEDEEDDQSECIGSVTASPSEGCSSEERRDDLMVRETVDAMKHETTKGAAFDPIDLTDCDYRLLVRKPVEAINIGFVEDADEAFDEIIETSTSIVTKTTRHLLGRNNTWYLG